MTIDGLIAGNARFVTDEFQKDPDYYNHLAAGQNPDVLWIGFVTVVVGTVLPVIGLLIGFWLSARWRSSRIRPHIRTAFAPVRKRGKWRQQLIDASPPSHWSVG